MAGVFPEAPTTSMFGGSSLFPQATSSSSSGLKFGMGQAVSPLGQSILQYQQELAGGFGVPSELATPDAARGANEAAIAKLATANPDLAEDLSRRMTGEEDPDKSIWDHVKGAVGDIMAPTLSIGMKALDIMSRPARIIPELIIDEGDDPMFMDVAQALSGSSKASGADVMRKFGVENDFAAGALGFAFDVAADPLTWVTFGGAGLGRQVIAKAAGMQVAEGVLKQTVEEAVQAGAFKMAQGEIDSASKMLIGRLFKSKGGYSRDFSEGIGAIGMGNISDEMVGAGLKAGNDIAVAVQTRTMPQLMKTEGMSQSIDILKANRALGGKVGKAAAGAMGGIRFRAFKYISPAIPGTEAFGFGRVAQMFNGHSGAQRLMSVVGQAPIGSATKVPAGEGAMAGWDDFTTFATGGWKGLQEKNGDLYNYMRGGSGIPGGSMMYSLSEQLGGLTHHLNSGGRVLRGGGLAGFMAVDGKHSANDTVADFITNYGYKLVDPENPQKTLVGPQEVAEKMASLKDLTREQQLKMRTYIDTTPDEVGEDLSGLNDWVATQEEAIGKRVGLDDDEAFELQENVRGKAEDIRKLHAELGEHADAAWLMKKLKVQHRAYANKMGARLGDVTSPVAKVPTVTKGQADEYAAEGHKAAQGDLYYTPTQGEHSALASRGFQPTEMEHTNGMGRGIVLTDEAPTEAITGPTADAVPAVARLDNPLVVDESVNALTEQSMLKEYYDDAYNAIDNQPEKFKLGTDEIEWEDVRVRKADEMVTEKLLKDGRDGIVRIGKDGKKRITVFRGSEGLVGKAKVVDNNSPIAVQTGGYYSRTYTKKMSTWLNGVIGDDKSLQSVFRQERHRALLHLNIDEAEGLIKEDLRKELRIAIDAASGTRKNQLEQSLAELDSIDVFHANPVDELFNYVQDVGRGIADHQLGAVAKRGARLSDLGAFGASGAVRTTNHGFVDDAARMKSAGVTEARILRVKGSKQAAAEMVTKQTMKLAHTQTEEYARLRDLIAEASGNVPLSVATRKGKAASRTFGKKMAEDIATGRRGLMKLKDELKKTRTAIDKLDEAKTATPGEVQSLEEVGFRSVAEIEEDIADQNQYLKDLMAVAKGDGPTASITKQLKDAYNLEKQAGQKLGDEAAKEAAKTAARVKPQQARLARLQIKMDKAANELNKLDASYKIQVEEMKPALVKLQGPGKTGYKTIDIPGMEDYAMPEFMADELNNAIRTKGLTGINKEYRRILAVWKKGSTVYWPGFHVRNHMGAFFNGILGNVGPGDYANAHRVLRNEGPLPDKFVKEHGLDWMQDPPKTWEDIHALASQAGIHGDNSRGIADIRNSLEEMEDVLKGGGSRVSRARRKMDQSKLSPGRLGTDMMKRSEDWHRTAAFLQGLKQTGGDVYGARQFTMLRHGDYEDLTDFEFSTMKSLLPFYKWMRTNLPYQFHNLLENPAKHLTAMKASDATFEMQGMDADKERGKLPEYMKNDFLIPKKDHDGAMSYMTLDLPMSDLFKGTNEYLSSFLPIVRPFIENQIGVSTFTGAPLTGAKKEITWAPGPIGDLLESVGFAEKGKDGKVFVTDKQENVLSIVPFYSRFRNWASADPKRVKKRMSTIMSVAAGVGITPFGPEELTSEEKAFYYTDLEPALQHMQEMGWQLPDKDAIDDSVYTALGFTPPASESTTGAGAIPSLVS